MNETQYTAQLKERFTKSGWLIHKTSERFTAGWPDLVCIGKGLVLFIEVKVGSNALSGLQDHTLKQIAKNGGMALVMRRKADGTEIAYQFLPSGDSVNITGIMQKQSYKELHNIIKERV